MDDPVRKLWLQAKFESNFKPPNILYAFDKNNEKFVVISDNSSIYRLINSKGQVYVVAHFRCTKDPNNKYYICDEPMHIISCKKHSHEEDQYANDVILPVVFK